MTDERERDFWIVEYLTISGGWFVNVFWNFILTFWVNANYQKQSQDKLIIIRFQALLLRWKKLNIYVCFVCVYIFKDNIFSYYTISHLKKNNHSYLYNKANYLIPWSLIRNQCVTLARFIQSHLFSQTLIHLLQWKYLVDVVKVHSSWL